MSISLKTHTVYPEIQFDVETKIGKGILYTQTGEKAFECEGEFTDRNNARIVITAKFKDEAVQFLKKEVTK